MIIVVTVIIVVMFAGLETLVINPRPEWLLQMDVSE